MSSLRMFFTLPPFSGGRFEQATLLGLALCLLLLFVVFRYGSARDVKYAPGPRPLPLVGNLFSVLKFLKKPHIEAPLLAKRFGGLCMLWIGPRPALVISSLEDAREILDKKGGSTADRPKSNIFQTRSLPNFVAWAHVGEDLRFFRRIYNDLLGPKKAQEIKKYQEYESRILLLDLCNNPDAFWAHGHRVAISVIFSAVYGIRISRLDHPLMIEMFSIWEGIFKRSEPGVLIIDWIPLLEKLPFFLQPWVRLADSLAAREYAVQHAFLQTLRKQIAAGIEPPCFGVDLINIQKQQKFDDHHAVGVLSGIVIGGAETTMNMVLSFFKLMALYPDAQQRAQEELDEVVGPLRLPTWEDNLPYIRALIKEVHRMCPVTHFGVPHATTEEMIYQGRTIPSGTTILPNMIALHRDPMRYEDAESFMPERFLGDDLDSLASAKHPDYRKRDHVNFGFGRRLCQEGASKRPNPFMVDITPRSDTVLKVIQNVAEGHPDIPDVDSVEIADSHLKPKAGL
ncbi:hypothetical protein Trco_006095 [Trichoderma cornu-damae]|uniref:Cytochrome P450 n=1 Tax=Trichoderma cornu-damae TaxID=654480 RepID=A0A9P8QR25_9HYPO|nr:hypothetical protein Trco_006095 [Trichoderma cornu-damae]